MSEFSQNGVVATLHDFSNRDLKDLERDLKKFSKDRKMELILPCLYSELEGNASLTIGGTTYNVSETISGTGYLVGGGLELDGSRVGLTYYSDVGGDGDSDMTMLYYGVMF